MGSEVIINFELTMLIIWTWKAKFAEEVDSGILSENWVFNDRHNKVTTYGVFNVWVFSCHVSFQRKQFTFLSTAPRRAEKFTEHFFQVFDNLGNIWP